MSFIAVEAVCGSSAFPLPAIDLMDVAGVGLDFFFTITPLRDFFVSFFAGGAVVVLALFTGGAELDEDGVLLIGGGFAAFSRAATALWFRNRMGS